MGSHPPTDIVSADRPVLVALIIPNPPATARSLAQLLLLYPPPQNRELRTKSLLAVIQNPQREFAFNPNNLHIWLLPKVSYTYKLEYEGIAYI